MLNRILENTLRLVLPPMKWAMHAYPTKQLLRFPWVCLCPKQAGHAAAVGVLAPNVADLISYGTTAHGHRTARPAISNRDLGGGGALGRFLPALLRAFVAFGAKSRARSHVFGAKELRPRANGRSRLRGVGPVQARSSSLPPVPVLSCPGGWSWTTLGSAASSHTPVDAIRPSQELCYCWTTSSHRAHRHCLLRPRRAAACVCVGPAFRNHGAATRGACDPHPPVDWHSCRSTAYSHVVGRLVAA
jgi:hypothetical protein